MKTWNRSLLRIGGGLDTIKVARYDQAKSQGSLSRWDLEPSLQSAPVSPPKDPLQPLKAHVFLQWKLHVARRIEAKEWLREEFRDLKAGVRDLTVRNQEKRRRIAKKRLFWAWNRLICAKATSQPVPMFLRKYISLWRQHTSLARSRRIQVQAKRSAHRFHLLLCVFKTWKQRPIALRKALRTLQKWTYLGRIRRYFRSIREGIQWKDVFSALVRRNEGRRQRRRQLVVMDTWKSWIITRKEVAKGICSLLKGKRQTLMGISLSHWSKVSKNTRKSLKIIQKYSRKALKFSFSHLFTRILERTANHFRSQLAIIPHQLESDFAAALETRIRAMRSDFEVERQDYLAQRTALLERQQALRQAFSRHADRIYQSLSSDIQPSED